MEVFGGFSDEDDDPGWLSLMESCQIVLAHQVVYWVKDSHQVAVGSGHLGGPQGGTGARGSLEPRERLQMGGKSDFHKYFVSTDEVVSCQHPFLLFPPSTRVVRTYAYLRIIYYYALHYTLNRIYCGNSVIHVYTILDGLFLSMRQCW